MRTFIRLAVLAIASVALVACQAVQPPASAPGIVATPMVSPTGAATASAAPTTASSQAPGSPAPASRAPASASPAADAVGHLFPSDVGRTLRAGRYDTGMAFATPLRFELPSAFTLEVLRKGNVALAGTTGGWLGIFAPDAVFADPCRADPPRKAPDSDAVVKALTAMRGFTSGPVTESVLGGRRARSFELSNAIDTAASRCTREAMLPLFTSIGNPDGEATNGGTRLHVWVVDPATTSGSLTPPYGGPLLVVAEGSDTELDAVRDVIGSLRFDDAGRAAVEDLSPADVGAALAPGRYDVGVSFATPLELTVPEGFTLDVLRPGSVGVSGPSGSLAVFAVNGVFADPCTPGKPTDVDNADAALALLRRMRGFAAGPITREVVGGQRAIRFDLANDIDTASAGCTRGAMLPLFTSVGNPDGEATNGGTRQVMWVVDPRGHGLAHLPFEGPIVIVADSFVDDPDRATLETIARSLAFAY